MQGDFIFDPAVITFDIANGAVNTSFYRREGTSNTESNITVDQLLEEVSTISNTCTCDVVYISVMLYIPVSTTHVHVNAYRVG